MTFLSLLRWPAVLPAILFIAITLIAFGISAVGVSQAKASSLDEKEGSVSYASSGRRADLFLQERGYSCGAAALATYVTFWLGDNLSEAKVLETLFQISSPLERERVEANGLSSEHLSAIVNRLGYREQWREISIEGISRIREPVIVFLNYGGQPHWAIFKGMRDGFIFLGDPAIGNIRVTLDEFRQLWAVRDGGRAGIMWALQRRDQRNLGAKSSLALSAAALENHKTLEQVRTAAVAGSGKPGRFQVSFSTSQSTSRRTVDVDGVPVTVATTSRISSPEVRIGFQNGWSMNVDADFVQSSSNISADSESEAIGYSYWGDATVSLSRNVSTPFGTESQLSAKLQLPIAAGSYGLGMGISTSKGYGLWVHSVGLNYFRQFAAKGASFDVLSRPIQSYGAHISSVYSPSYSIALAFTASAVSLGAKTLGFGTTSVQTVGMLEARLVWVVTRDVTFQPAIRVTRSGGKSDPGVSFTLSRDF